MDFYVTLSKSTSFRPLLIEKVSGVHSAKSSPVIFDMVLNGSSTFLGDVIGVALLSNASHLTEVKRKDKCKLDVPKEVINTDFVHKSLNELECYMLLCSNGMFSTSSEFVTRILSGNSSKEIL